MYLLGHATDACPTLQEEPTFHANAIGGFSGPSQRGHDPFSNTYNPGWRDHPNLRYGNQPQNFQRGPYQPPPPPPQSNSNTVKKSYNSKRALGVGTHCKIEQKILVWPRRTGQTGEELENSPKQAEKSNQVGEEHPKVFVPKLPFPKRFFKSKKEEEEKDIFETLRKVEVNIPLLNTIKQVPCYAKFLKEMCTNKSKLRGNAMFDGGGASKLTKHKSPTSSPRTYKNKAFHEKISSRKKSSMDRQVLLNPHHHRVHYIEEVNLDHQHSPQL
ncbi:UNVERIFIED_CONTAM: hypothetical protein Slati_4253800 [Sesamum latifolium]|uniref:Retrotransposon gag protein n=1 Tax=Sesamum latifolium TaxID=2727402 RepID=A0AAW2TBS2_9LAMI